MKHLLQRVATHLTKPGYFCSLQIVAGLVGASAAGAVHTHFQTLSHMAADSLTHRIGSQILHSIPVLASLSGELNVNALAAPLAGAVVGALLTMMGSGLDSRSILNRRTRAEPQSARTVPGWMNSASSARQV